jgi:hypothetical protein
MYMHMIERLIFGRLYCALPLSVVVVCKVSNGY